MKTLKLSYYDWLGQCSLKTKMPNLPLGTHALASQKLSAPTVLTKYPMQSKTLRAKCKGLLVSQVILNHTSLKMMIHSPEKSPFTCTCLCFFMLSLKRNRGFFSEGIKYTQHFCLSPRLLRSNQEAKAVPFTHG